MPNDNGLGPRVRDNNDGTICVEYEPKCEGRHEVLMTHNGNAVKGKGLFHIHVYYHHSFIHFFYLSKVLYLAVKGKEFNSMSIY